ncbi:LysR substrate-binding domain-containing protein [Caulobacter sp. LARHSG274]
MMQTRDVHDRGASISFRQLKLFAAVERYGGLQRAARACGMSQPAATQALSVLQAKIAVTLLERGPGGMALTPPGKTFHARVGRICDQLDETISDLGPVDHKAVANCLTPAQVRTLSAVLETGSLELAARATGVTREGLRRSARALEKRTGPLFVPTPDGTGLSLEGRRFAERVRALRDEVALGVRELHAQQARAETSIVVGAAQAFGNRFLARVLADLAMRHCGARITVLREGPVELVDRLRAGEVDLVVGDIEETGHDLVKERLVRTPYFVFGRPGHPLSGAEAATLDQLIAYDWVGGTPGSARETAREALFAGMSPPQVAFAASEGAIVGHFVAGSDRLALMTEHESRCGGLALGKLPFAPIEAGLGIDVVRRADRQPSQLHLELIELLRAHLLVSAPEAVGGAPRRVA